MKAKQSADNKNRDNKNSDNKDLDRKTLYQRLHLVSFGKGLLIALVLIALSLPVGNWQALNAKLEAAQRTWEGLEVDNKPIPADQQVLISRLIKERADAATNLLTLMNNYPNVGVEQRQALERARDAMRAASDPASTARADHDLFASFQEAMDALISQTTITPEHYELLDAARVAFNEQGRKLTIRARDFDRQMQKAIDTYNDLPTRRLFARPELYESIAAALKEGTT